MHLELLTDLSLECDKLLVRFCVQEQTNCKNDVFRFNSRKRHVGALARLPSPRKVDVQWYKTFHTPPRVRALCEHLRRLRPLIFKEAQNRQQCHSFPFWHSYPHCSSSSGNGDPGSVPESSTATRTVSFLLCTTPVALEIIDNLRWVETQTPSS